MAESIGRGCTMRFDLSRDLAHVARAGKQIEERLTSAGCTATNAQLFAAAAEEVLVNVVNHAWPVGEDHRFNAWLSLTHGAGTLQARLVVQDDGIAFDPTRQVPEPDLDADLDSRIIGGLGVLMVRRLTDEQRYARIGALNVLEIAKTFGIGSEGDT